MIWNAISSTLAVMSDATLSSARITRIERPAHHFMLLHDANGYYLNTSDGVTLNTSEHVDDQAIWQHAEQQNEFRHVLTGLTLSGTSEFTIARGPSRLPSQYLQEFRQNGWVCLPAILDDDTVDELARVACVGPWSGCKFEQHVLPLNQNSAVAKVSVEPVSLWLTRQYLRSDDIRMGHSPSMAVLSKDDGERDVQGWHTDFPYLWGSPLKIGGDRIPAGSSGTLLLGVQRNICISAFTKANGATCFKLGSHDLNIGPPRDWGVDADYAHTGYRRQHGLPYSGADTDIIEAPPGSIILYDARTWHRAGVNQTDEKRAAMLQALTPMYIMPFKDTSESYKTFIASPLAEQLTERERVEIARLMIHQIIGPFGHHAITVDEELTAQITANLNG